MTAHLESTRLPLAGVRVMDLTHVWSGPMATRVLAGLGADVIKLESPNKPDALRGNASDIELRYPDLDAGPDSINRNAWYNTTNVDKRGVVLDLKSPEGMEIARKLVAISDVVIANYRPGVLDRMGLGFEELISINPTIVLVEMPGYTADSPQAKSPAFGAQFDAQSGSATLTGGLETPLLTGFALGDPASGLMAGNAVMSALVRARRAKLPTHVVLAQSEAMMPLLGEYFLSTSAGRPIVEDVNADRRNRLQGIFPTVDGSWLAVAVGNDRQVAALHELMVEKGADADELPSYVGGFADAATGAQFLQAKGIPAAAMQGGKELIEDPQLAHSGFFNALTHPSAGTHRYPGLPILIDGGRIGTRTPAPLFKEHTEAVMAELLGLKTEEIRSLTARGVLGVLEGQSQPEHAPIHDRPAKEKP